MLAAQQWLATPLPLALEMLAALRHAQPPGGHRAGRARRPTCSSSGPAAAPSSGYAATPERVDEVVRAIAEAMHARGIRYSEPPASWSDLGQQVRTPGDVLTWRVGTPLDTVVVLAAALEQAGIRPLLWLGRRGTRFLGYWREERSAESAATTDAAPLVNLVDLGLIGLVETTLLTSMGEPGADLHRPAYTGWLTGELDRILGVTDVHRARRDGIFPLPARARDAAGVLQVVEYRPAEHSAPAPVEPAPRRRRRRPEAPARVQQWKNALLDLSLRNRLINYTERSGLAAGRARHQPRTRWRTSSTTARRSPCCRPTSWPPSRRSAASPPPRDLPEEQLAEPLVERREVHADVTTGGYLPRLRGLAYKAKTVQEETGANNLYLALGSLVWELDGRPLRSPLVLIPVTLAPLGRTGAYRLTLDESGSSTPELLPAGEAAPAARPRRPDADRAGRRRRSTSRPRCEAMRRRAGRARAALPGRGDGRPRDPAVRQVPAVEGPRRALGRLRGEPAGRATWCTSRPRRSRTRRATPPASPTSTSSPRSCPPRPTPRSCGRSPRPRPAARSCSRARPAPASRRPSPTCSPARSPTGKRVLFVAEKRAALDVVARRLDAVGMGMFALDLHDKGSRASMVRAQIRLALEHAVAVDEQGLAADEETLRSARRMLARYADRLHDDNAAGLSLYSARTVRAGRRHATSSRCRCPSRSSPTPPAEVLHAGADGAGAAARHRRPDPPVAAPPVGVRRLPRHRPARHPGRGGRGRRGRARRGGDPELAGRAAPRADDRRARRARARARPARAIGPRRHRRDVHRALDGGDRRRCWARSRPSPPSATRASTSCTPRGARACRWPRSTWPRRPPPRRPGGAAAAG